MFAGKVPLSGMGSCVKRRGTFVVGSSPAATVYRACWPDLIRHLLQMKHC